MEPYYTFEETSELLQYKPSYLYKLMHERKITYYKPMNGRVLFKESDIEKFIQQGKRPSQNELGNQAMITMQQMEQRRRTVPGKRARNARQPRRPEASLRITAFRHAAESSYLYRPAIRHKTNRQRICWAL